MQRPRRNRGQQAAGLVSISEKKYKELLSRPKPSTLRRDERQGQMRKGKRGNPYLQTLLDPMRVTGVKVPDVTSFPSSTFQLYGRKEYTVGANPFAVAVQAHPLDSYAECTNLNGATAFSNWGSVDEYTAINGTYHSLRPVSGVLQIYTSASSTTNQGELAVAILPKQQSLGTSAMGTFDKVAKRFGAFRTPLKSGAEILWMPQDPASREFALPSAASTDQIVASDWPAWIAAVEGAESGTIVIIEWFWNYEAVPEEATWNLVNASAPYISSKDLEEATGVMASIGSFAHSYGEDLGAYLLDMGARVGSDLTKHLVSGGVHYAYSRMGLRGATNHNVLIG